MTILMIVVNENERPFGPTDEKWVATACEKVEAAIEMLVYRKLILTPPVLAVE